MISLKHVFKISEIILIIILNLSCKKNEKAAVSPVVTTTPVMNILYSTAISGGTVTNDGGAQVSIRGVCWGTSSGATTNDSITTDGTGTGQFYSLLKGLAFGTRYYMRAYATSTAGTSYGNEIEFTTKKGGTAFNQSLTYGAVTDIDGKSYKTIPIGIQTWMAENLGTSKLNDGTTIPLITDAAQWTNSLTPAFSWFDDNQQLYENIYGAYYNWFAVSTGKLCPAGWHVPSDDEWQLLIDYLGGSNSAGSKIKETGTNNWNASNSDATNASGFTGLPAGQRTSTDGSFNGQGFYGGWWSATELLSSPLSASWVRWAHSDTTVFARNQLFKKDGFTVRCIKD